MGDAIARGVVTDPLVTSSPATQGVTSGQIVGPPGGGVTPIIPVEPQMADQYTVKQSAANPEGLSGSIRYDWDFKSDGTKAYTWRNGGIASSSFREYDLDVPWSITGADWNFVSSVLIGGANARTFEWSPDGNFLCTLQRWFSSSYRLINYNQSDEPWSIANGLSSGGAATVGTNIDTGSFHVSWRPDGLMVFTDHNGGILEARSVAVAFDASTLTTTPVATFDTTPERGTGSFTMDFSADGMILYSVTTGNLLCSWDLSAPYDISAPSNFATGVSVILPTPLQIPRGLVYRDDTGDIFLERDQSSQNVRCWEPSTSPNIDEFSFNAEATLTGDANAIALVDIAIRPGGTDLYVNRERTSGTNVFQWTMSAHDLSSLAFLDSDFPIGGSSSPRGIALREDDGSAYFLNWRNPTNPDAVFRWPIPTAWDVGSRVTNDDNRLFFNNGNLPRGLWFKPDGTEMYYIDDAVDTVYQWTLLSPWTVAGATNTATFDVSPQASVAVGVCFSEDGAKMFISGLNPGDVTIGDIYQFNLVVPWDVSSASYSGRSLSLPGGTGVRPTGIAMKDETLYVIYNTNNVVEQFTV